jgi:hypothetical protein
MKIQDHLTKEPGHIIKVIAKTEDLMPEDQEVLLFCLKQPFFLEYTPQPNEPTDPEWPDLVASQAFDLPYEQGPGFTVIEKLPTRTPEAVAEHYWGPEYTPEDLEMVKARFTEYGDFTGWLITFGYTDSMTNIWTTPIYRTKTGEFTTEEM